MGKLIAIDHDAYWLLISCIPAGAKRSNARDKVKKATAKTIDLAIKEHKDLLRSLRSESEGVKRGVYEEISKLERKKLEMLENF